MKFFIFIGVIGLLAEAWFLVKENEGAMLLTSFGLLIAFWGTGAFAAMIPVFRKNLGIIFIGGLLLGVPALWFMGRLLY